MKGYSKFAAMALFAILAISNIQAEEIIWNEVGDAGAATPASDAPPRPESLAQDISGPANTVVSQINGTIMPDNPDRDVDVYCIYIADFENFSALAVADFDTQLFLFTHDGFGVYMNDDNASDQDGKGTEDESILTSFLPNPGLGDHDGKANTDDVYVGPTANGCYLLAITGFNTDPHGSGPMGGAGPIFPNAAGPNAFTHVFGPTDNAGALFSWPAATGAESGAYSLMLTGVTIEPEGIDCCGDDEEPPVEPIPEPATLALLGIGMGLLASRRRKIA